MIKKPSHATVPLIYKYSAQLAIIKEKYQNLMYGYRMLGGTYMLVPPLRLEGAVPTYPPLWPPEARRRRRLVCVA
jgi:hypothetical protein